jgi:hypothetical protein
MDQVTQQQHRDAVQQQAKQPGARLGAAEVAIHPIAQRPHARGGRRIDDLAQQAIGPGQKIHDQPAVDDQKVEIGPERSRRGRQAVEDGLDLLADMRLRCFHVPQHGVRQHADFRRQPRFRRRQGRASQRLAGGVEIHQRIAQQRVIRFEVVHQGRFFGQGGFQVFERTVGSDELRPAGVGRAQGPQRPSQIVAALRQRVVTPQQAGAGEQHVAIERGVADLEGEQRLVQPGFQGRIRPPTLPPDGGQQRQQRDDDRQRLEIRAHQRRSGAVPANGRPLYSPVRLRRNWTIRLISVGARFLPNCTRAMVSTASSSVAARPS